MPDRRDAAQRNHVPAANCLSPAPTRGDKRHRKAPNTPATRPSCRSVRLSLAKSAAPSPRATAPPVRCPTRALQPTQRPQPLCPAPIPAELSSGAAAPLKTNPARNTNPDAPRRSSRDRRICFSFPDGIPGISPCGESRLECRAFPVPLISHAPTILWCAAPAMRTPARGSFRRTRLQKFQTRVRAAPAPDSARGTPGTSAPLPLSRPVSGCAPFVHRLLRSTPDTRGYAYP